MEWRPRRKGHIYFPHLMLYSSAYLITALPSMITTEHYRASPLRKQFFTVESQPNGFSDLVEIKYPKKSEYNLLYSSNLATNPNRDEFTETSKMLNHQYSADNKNRELNSTDNGKIKNSVQNYQKIRRSPKDKCISKTFSKKRTKRCTKTANTVALKPLKATRLNQQDPCNNSSNSLCNHAVGRLVTKILKIKDHCNCTSDLVDLSNEFKNLEQILHLPEETDRNATSKLGVNEVESTFVNADGNTGKTSQLSNYNPDFEMSANRSEFNDDDSDFESKEEDVMETPKIAVDLLIHTTEETTLKASVNDNLEFVISESSKLNVVEKRKKFNPENVQKILPGLFTEYKDMQNTEPLSETQLDDSREKLNEYKLTSHENDNENGYDFNSNDDFDYTDEFYTENEFNKTDPVSGKTTSDNDDKIKRVLEKIMTNDGNKSEFVNSSPESYNAVRYQDYNYSEAVAKERDSDANKKLTKLTGILNNSSIACRNYFAKASDPNYTGTLSPVEIMLCTEVGRNQHKLLPTESPDENVDIKYLKGNVHTTGQQSLSDVRYPIITSEEIEDENKLTKNAVYLSTSPEDSLTHDTSVTFTLNDTPTKVYKYLSNLSTPKIIKDDSDQNTPLPDVHIRIESQDNTTVTPEEIRVDRVHGKPQYIDKNNDPDNIIGKLTDVTLISNAEEKTTLSTNDENNNTTKEVDNQDSIFNKDEIIYLHQVFGPTTVSSPPLGLTPDVVSGMSFEEEEAVENVLGYDYTTGSIIHFSYTTNVTKEPVDLKILMDENDNPRFDVAVKNEGGTNTGQNTEPHYPTPGDRNEIKVDSIFGIPPQNNINGRLITLTGDAEENLTHSTNDENNNTPKADQNSILKKEEIADSQNVLESTTVSSLPLELTPDIMSSISAEEQTVQNKVDYDNKTGIHLTYLTNATKAQLEMKIKMEINNLTNSIGVQIQGIPNVDQKSQPNNHIAASPEVRVDSVFGRQLDTVENNDVDVNDILTNVTLTDDGEEKITASTNNENNNKTKETDDKDSIFNRDEDIHLQQVFEPTTVSSSPLGLTLDVVSSPSSEEQKAVQNVLGYDYTTGSIIDFSYTTNVTKATVDMKTLNDNLRIDVAVKNEGGRNVDQNTTGAESKKVLVGSIFGTPPQDAINSKLTDVTLTSDTEEKLAQSNNDTYDNNIREMDNEDAILNKDEVIHLHQVLEPITVISAPVGVEREVASIFLPEVNDFRNTFGGGVLETTEPINVNTVLTGVSKPPEEILTGMEELEANFVRDQQSPENYTQNEITNTKHRCGVHKIAKSMNLSNTSRGLSEDIISGTLPQDIVPNNADVHVDDNDGAILKYTTDMDSVEPLISNGNDNMSKEPPVDIFLDIDTTIIIANENNYALGKQEPINVSNATVEEAADFTPNIQEGKAAVSNNNKTNNYEFTVTINVTTTPDGLETELESRTPSESLFSADAYKNAQKSLVGLNNIKSQVNTTKPSNQSVSGTEGITYEINKIDNKEAHHITEPINTQLDKVELEQVTEVVNTIPPLKNAVQNTENDGERYDEYTYRVTEPINVTKAPLGEPIERNATLNKVTNDLYKATEPINVSDLQLELMPNIVKSMLPQDILSNDFSDNTYNDIANVYTPIDTVESSATGVSNINGNTQIDNIIEDSIEGSHHIYGPVNGASTPGQLDSNHVNRSVSQENHFPNKNEVVNYVTTAQSDYYTATPVLTDLSENMPHKINSSLNTESYTVRDENRINLSTPSTSNKEIIAEHPDTYEMNRRLDYRPLTIPNNSQQQYLDSSDESVDLNAVNSMDKSMLPKLIPVGMINDVTDSNRNQGGLLAMLQLPVVLQLADPNLIDSPDSKFYIENNGKKLEINLIKSDERLGSSKNPYILREKGLSDTLANDKGKRSLNDYKSNSNELPNRYMNKIIPSLPQHETNANNDNLKINQIDYSVLDKKRFNNTPHLYDSHKYLKNLKFPSEEQYKRHIKADKDATERVKEDYGIKIYRKHDKTLNLRSEYDFAPLRQSKRSPRNNIAETIRRMNNEPQQGKFSQNQNIVDVLYTTVKRLRKLFNE